MNVRKYLVTPVGTYARRVFKGTYIREYAGATKSSRISYSQYGEDMVIRSYYDKIGYFKGIYVNPEKSVVLDIGSYRPIVLSNSFYFYRKGFTCINVDATPGSKAVFDSTRPRDINVEVAVGLKDGTGTFYSFGTPSVWNTMDAESAAFAVKSTNVAPEMHNVQIQRIETILDMYIKDCNLEMLFIDVEGVDFQVLQSNNFEKYRPRVILIEASHLNPSEITTNPISTYLQALDYTLYSWIAPSLMFVRNDSTV